MKTLAKCTILFSTGCLVFCLLCMPIAAAINAGIAPYSLGGTGSGYTVPFSMISPGIPYYHAWSTNSYQLNVGDHVDTFSYVSNFLTMVGRNYALYSPYIADQGRISLTSDIKYIQTYDTVQTGNSYFILDFSFSGRAQTDHVVSINEMFGNISTESILSYTVPYYAAVVGSSSGTVEIATNPFSVIAYTANIDTGTISQIFNVYNYNGQEALRPSPLDNYSASSAKHSLSLNIPYNQISNPDDAMFFRLIFNVNGFSAGQRMRIISFILPVYVSQTTTSEISADIKAEINGISIKIDDTNSKLDDVNGKLNDISNILSEDLSGISGSDSGNHWNETEVDYSGEEALSGFANGYISAAKENLNTHWTFMKSSQVWIGLVFAGNLLGHIINKIDFLPYLFAIIFLFIIYSAIGGLTRATSKGIDASDKHSSKSKDDNDG